MNKILAAVDFSGISAQVVGVTAEMAERFAGEVWLVHVAAPDPDFVGFGVGPDGVREKRARELRAEHRQLQQMAEDLRDRGLEAHARLIQGPTVETLVAEAQRLDVGLIVVGSHGRGLLSRAVLGSVSEGVMRRASCPVLVIPARRDSTPE